MAIKDIRYEGKHIRRAYQNGTLVWWLHEEQLELIALCESKTDSTSRLGYIARINLTAIQQSNSDATSSVIAALVDNLRHTDAINTYFVGMSEGFAAKIMRYTLGHSTYSDVSLNRSVILAIKHSMDYSTYSDVSLNGSVSLAINHSMDHATDIPSGFIATTSTKYCNVRVIDYKTDILISALAVKLKDTDFIDYQSDSGTESMADMEFAPLTDLLYEFDSKSSEYGAIDQYFSVEIAGGGKDKTTEYGITDLFAAAVASLDQPNTTTHEANMGMYLPPVLRDNVLYIRMAQTATLTDGILEVI